MDSNSLYYSLELVAGSGSTLSVEQRAALQTSLVMLKKNYKFHRVLFWGKILGLKSDYFIAQGRGEDEMQDRKSLYSFNCMDWFLLPPATDSMIEDVSKAAKSRFIGDPSFVYEHPENTEGQDGAVVENEAATKVNEESRLAVAVHQIEEEVSVVPRGAFVKSPLGLVQINRSFGGLSHSEAQKLDSFLHFSKAKNPKKSILEMGDLNPAIDFLDVLSDDIPKGETTDCNMLPELVATIESTWAHLQQALVCFMNTEISPKISSDLDPLIHVLIRVIEAFTAPVGNNPFFSSFGVFQLPRYITTKRGAISPPIIMVIQLSQEGFLPREKGVKWSMRDNTLKKVRKRLMVNLPGMMEEGFLGICWKSFRVQRPDSQMTIAG